MDVTASGTFFPLRILLLSLHPLHLSRLILLRFLIRLFVSCLKRLSCLPLTHIPVKKSLEQPYWLWNDTQSLKSYFSWYFFYPLCARLTEKRTWKEEIGSGKHTNTHSWTEDGETRWETPTQSRIWRHTQADIHTSSSQVKRFSFYS